MLIGLFKSFVVAIDEDIVVLFGICKTSVPKLLHRKIIFARGIHLIFGVTFSVVILYPHPRLDALLAKAIVRFSCPLNRRSTLISRFRSQDYKRFRSQHFHSWVSADL